MGSSTHNVCISPKSAPLGDNRPRTQRDTWPRLYRVNAINGDRGSSRARLMRSIADVGLLEPRTVTMDGRLINRVLNIEPVESAMSSHIAAIELTKCLAKMRQEYEMTGYARVTELVSSDLVASIRQEIEQAFAMRAVRRDFQMAATDMTPRRMSNLRFIDIDALCPLVATAYQSTLLRTLISAVVGEQVHSCPWEHEKYIATRLHRRGDTHGWHWDDYAFSLLWVLKAPPADQGGSLEFIPNTRWRKSNPNLARFLSENPVEVRAHRTGDLYLFRSDRLWHRVTPIADGTERMILNMVYADGNQRFEVKTHETMLELFK